MSDDAHRPNGKPEHLDRLSSVWRRLSERKIAQWSVAYVALAYAIQHGVVLTEEAYEWPHAVQQISMLLLTLGLPVVMTFAWYHGERASRRISGPELTIIAILLAIGSLFFYVLVRPAQEATASRVPGLQQEGIAGIRNASLNPGSALSLAVLPFANLSGDAAQEFFSDGMTEEITSALAKVPDLRVVARASAFQFKGEKKDMRAVGQALNARYLIDGSVRRAGTRVRISAQLIEATNGLQVWTENYDRELTDIFATQEDIARAIAASLRVPLGLQPGRDLVSNRDIESEAYQQYLRARALVRARSFSTPLSSARTLLEGVVKRDPNFAPAWALLGLASCLTPGFDTAYATGSAEEFRRVIDSSLPRAEETGRRAVQLDGNLADGYVALGCAVAARGKNLESEEFFLKALSLDPNNPDALSLYSNVLIGVARLKDALATRQRLLALEPVVPIYIQNAAFTMWLNGQTEAAIALLKTAPPGSLGSIRLAQVYATAGRFKEAADTLQQTPAGTVAPGVLDDAIRLLRASPQKAPPQTLPRFSLIDFVYLGVGAPERVLETPERDIESGYVLSFNIAAFWHPAYAAVRKMERFKILARRMGVIDYWRAKGWPEFCHPTTGDDFACE